MGLTKVTTKLTSRQSGGESCEGLFLVDTGATDTLAPADALTRVGVKPVGKMACEPAEGTGKEYPDGLGRIEFMDEITAGRVVLGEPNSEPLRGVSALESAGIMVDPVKRTLERLPAIPLK
jgi:predicted aspartyl protease